MMTAREGIVASILWLNKRHGLIKIASLLILMLTVMPFILLIASFSQRFERFWDESVYEAFEAGRD